MQQLDIFEDSRDRVHVNALADAVAAGEAAEAALRAEALRREFEADPHLAPAALLIAALRDEARAAGTRAADNAEVLAASQRLGDTIAPAALALLGARHAPPWLAARWQAIARRASGLPFDPAHPDAHAAAAWLRARHWAAAAQAVEGIESWRHKPQPLDWMAQAQWHLAGPDAAWPLLAELAWRSPSRVPGLLERLPDARLRKLARTFEAAFDAALDWAWWPAWLLVEQPLLAAPLEAARTEGSSDPEGAFKLVQALLRMERQGRHAEIVDMRRRLQALHPGLLAAYMATR